MQGKIEPGDFVTVGDNSLTWEVLRIDGDVTLCKSGRSDREVQWFTKHLVLFKKGVGNDA